MKFLRSTNCADEGCPDGPCGTPDSCDISASVFDSTDYDGHFALRSGGPLLVAATLFIDFDAFTIADRLEITISAGVDASTTPIYDSGCVTGSHSTSVTIGPGNSTIEVKVHLDCAATGTFSSWQFDLSCAGAP